MKNSFLHFITIFLLSITCYSQFSKTHYIPPLSKSDNLQVATQILYISTPSLTPINFTINQIGGTSVTGTVSRDVPYLFDISSNNPNQLVIDNTSVNSVMNDKGFIIEAEDLIYVTARLIDNSGNQAGELVSKGLAALGTQFRIGGFTNELNNNYSTLHQTFISILATENNTTIDFNDIKTGAVLINNISAGNNPANVVLNAGESFIIAVQGPTNANRDALIGSLVISDKPIAVNCGSFAGTNGEMNNIDLGFDQIVSAERTGSEYIFIKNDGLNNVERVLLIANQDNTQIFLNNSTTPNYTLNAGQYVNLLGTDFSSNGTMYVHTNNTTANPKTLFAYQSVGDGPTSSQANQEMFFVPPLSCQTPKAIDNIPLIDEIGGNPFVGRVTLVTKTGSPLNFIINSVPYTLATLPASITVDGPLLTTGNPNYECYTITGLSGNVSAFSTTELYLAAYGSSGAATFGGFYSGFTFRPDIVFDEININQSSCIPNVELKVSSLSGFDTFQWFFNGTPIIGATNSNYTPTPISQGGLGPGNYYVSATLLACNLTLTSDNIPVSNCPTNIDNDNANDNIDLDNDNDGITNCTESFGDQIVNFNNLSSGIVATQTYSNSFIGNLTTQNSISTTPLTVSNDGSFISEIPAGKTNSLTYKLTFSQPISIGLEYITTANATDLLNSTGEYIVSTDIDKTITVLNPNNQLLIDTNYDGFYESGITQYSSFEIRFRLNNSASLPAGTGTFKFQTHLSNSISFTHKNLSDALSNRVSLKFFAICVPKDSDGEGISDQLDFDSDNDGITDYYEAQGTVFTPISNNDSNNDGLDDAFGTGLTPSDIDNDGVTNYLDLDSDNDGIYDLVESGSNATDNDLNGVIDGALLSFGVNGLSNTLETSLDNGILTYILVDSDSDGIKNHYETDSDNDNCPDVIEAGFADNNNDWLLGGSNPPIVNSQNGIVTSGTGYSIPNGNYIISAPISITTQPQNTTKCELETVTFSVTPTTVNSYEWQVSTNNGTTWNILLNNVNYSGVNTNQLTISNTPASFNGNLYRVFLNRNGNTCGLYSTSAKLTTHALPVITSPITLVQCDNDTDGISTFNLTQKNDVISLNSLNETFTYYTSASLIASSMIPNPIAFTTPTAIVYVKVANSNGCYRIATLNLIVSVTQIPTTFHISDKIECDDEIATISTKTDGYTAFQFSTIANQVKNNILAILPSTGVYSIKFYKDESDFLAETDALGNSLEIPITTLVYRNIVPNLQTIWVRVESNVSNDCYGFTKFNLVVESIPILNSVGTNNIIRSCDDNHDGTLIFNTSTIHSQILGGQTNKIITYVKQNGTVIPSPFPATYAVTNSETITVTIKNNTTNACFETGTFKFIVDDLPQAYLPTTVITTVCDDETNPLLQNGYVNFNTTNFESEILNGQPLTDFSIAYYTSSNAPLTDIFGTPITSPFPNSFITNNQTIKAVVKNRNNTSCEGSINIPFTVNPTPKIELSEEELVCTNLPTFTVTLNAGILDGTPISNYTYQWYHNGASINGATSYSLTVNSGGIYSVNVTNSTNCTKTKTIDVVESDIAHIQNIEITDLTDINSVLINVTGTGEYVYSLDNEYFYQESNLLTNVPIGIHTVYIKDIKGSVGCGVVTKEISVLGAPKYFTPNGDGINDYWNIKGISDKYYPKSIIYIFDRYGKLIKQISANNQGWDGKYNGDFAPSDDYWFTVNFDDGRTAKGHFSLKR